MFLILLSARFGVQAQEYVSPLQAVETGKSPGVQIKLICKTSEIKTYVLIFSPGDEVKSGLTEFAKKYKIKNAHFSAVGDAASAKVGYFDYGKKMFRVITIHEPSEVTSMTGNITVFKGDPVAHAHVSVATEDGSVKGGHLLEMIVGPTLEVFVTVYPTPLFKKIDSKYGAAVIDVSLER